MIEKIMPGAESHATEFIHLVSLWWEICCGYDGDDYDDDDDDDDEWWWWWMMMMMMVLVTKWTFCGNGRVDGRRQNIAQEWLTLLGGRLPLLSSEEIKN